MKHFYTFLVTLFLSGLGFGQTLSPGDLAIIGVGVDDENFLLVALNEIPSGESVFFTDEEWNGSGFNSGEGFYEWITPTITAGTVITVTTSGTTSGGTVIARSGSFALGNSGDGIFLYQTSTNTYNSGTYNILGFAGESSSNAGTLAGTGLVIGENALYFGGDNGIYTGVRSGGDKTFFLNEIYDSTKWVTSGSSQTYDSTNFILSSASTETVDFCNLQFPGTVEINQGATFDVYAQIYENGAAANTEPGGQASNIAAWIGVSTTDATTVADFTSSDWTWTPMNYFGDAGNNDEYALAFGATLTPGDYYYVSRFSIDGGAFAYGGSDVIDGDGGNFWDGTDFVSGQLTVNPQIPTTAATFNINGCGDSESFSTAYDASTQGIYWVELIYDGNCSEITIDTETSDFDTELGIYDVNGTLIAEDDDSGTDTLSLLTQTGLASGTYYIAAGPFNVDFGPFFNVITNNNTQTGTLVINARTPNTPDFCNLQFPGSVSITQGSTFDAYAQIYEDGNTPGPGAGTNITAEFGISTVDATSTADFESTDWVWVNGSYLGEVGNNDEYTAALGATLSPGTYFFVSRFSVDGGSFAYGGNDISDGDGGNFWDGINFVSGQLTVNPKPEPSNHVSTFTATTDSSSEITLTWNDNNGVEVADGFLIVGKTGAATFYTPVDGTDPSDDTDWSDDEIEVKIANGIQTYTVTGLSSNTTYDFRIYPYTNSANTIDFKTDGFIPEDSATTLEMPIVIITEIMQNPSNVNDADGEYFEVYNPTNNPIDMIGWEISDNDSDNHTISSSVIVPAFGFAVFGINADSNTNGGVTVDYEYSGITLANGADEIVIADDSSNEIDRVEYDGGSNWPNPTGAAMVYIGSDIEDNNTGSLWTTATASEGIDIDFGSPGSNGTDQIVAYLVFSSGFWNTIPTASTGTRTGLIKSNETTSFTTNVALDNLIVKEGADLTITAGSTLTLNSMTLESTSSSYSSLILDGTIVGTINYSRYVNVVGTGATGTGGNDLISMPLIPTGGISFDEFIALGDPANSTKLATNGVFYAFAPYNNLLSLYTNYLVLGFDALVSGQGYRVATTAGENLTFTGNVPSGTVAVDISRPLLGNQWNLIGNPFPSYIDPLAFLSSNTGVFDDSAIAIYGYNSGTFSGSGSTSGNFTIINFATNNGLKIAPGQGFFIAARDVPNFSGSVGFTNGSDGFADIRTTAGNDDFIEGRANSTSYNFKLNLINSNTFSTDFYFNSNSSLGLDPGYDAAVFGANANSFPIYSHLVNDNNGRAMAIQSLGDSDLSNVSIPIGVNALQGEQITFNISENSLPNDVNVYLEDNVANTYTLLSSGDYTITPNENLNGTGRFYLNITNSTLSAPENTLANIDIYTNALDKTIVIAGELLESTNAKVYDIQGRLVHNVSLQTTSRTQTIDVSQINAGVYVVELRNAFQNKTQKVIIK